MKNLNQSRFSVLFLILILALTEAKVTKSHKIPLILAHRGTSGTHPEESGPAYERAIEVGADYLECDLQATQDGVLVCSHEPHLSYLTTDIEDEKHRKLFPASEKKKEVIDIFPDRPPTVREGWFIADYPWEVVKTINLVQRYFERDHQYDGKFPHITLDELIDYGVQSGKGIYIESKDSTWYSATRNINLPKLMIENLCKRGFCKILPNEIEFKIIPTGDPFPCPIFLQSFCFDDLVYWDTVGATQFIPTVALVENNDNSLALYGELEHRLNLTAENSQEFLSTPNSEHASGVSFSLLPLDIPELRSLSVSAVGIDKFMVLRRPEMVKEFQDAGLAVHVWTIRNENGAIEFENVEKSANLTSVQKIMDSQFEGDVYQEMEYFYNLGVDALFTDFAGSMRNFLRFLTPFSSPKCQPINRHSTKESIL